MAFITNDLQSNYAGLYDTRVGFGKSAAIISIDFIRFYTEPGAAFYGDGVVQAVKQSATLYAAARRAGLPVIYTNVLYDEAGTQGGMFVKKVPALRRFVAEEPLVAFDPLIAPEPGDVVLTKFHSSAFFGTPLNTILRVQGHDTVILTGCSTSGCVRATAVDAISNGFRVIVPEECVGDRHQGPHDANLFDINAKYGDVMRLADVMAHIEGK